jgi:hypothetical protein
MRSGGQKVKNASPIIHLVGTGPQNLLSSELPRLSPIMNQCPGGILIGVGKLHSAALPHGSMYESSSRTNWLVPAALRKTWPS